MMINCDTNIVHTHAHVCLCSVPTKKFNSAHSVHASAFLSSFYSTQKKTNDGSNKKKKEELKEDTTTINQRNCGAALLAASAVWHGGHLRILLLCWRYMSKHTKKRTMKYYTGFPFIHSHFYNKWLVSQLFDFLHTHTRVCVCYYC